MTEQSNLSADEITGGRELSENEIALINQITIAKNSVGAMVEVIRKIDADLSPGEKPAIDQMWLAIGKTDLQKGFMALVRAVAQPGGF